MTIDLDELERLAKAAPSANMIRVSVTAESVPEWSAACAYYSAANPVTVLALVARIRLAEEWARKGLFSFHGGRCSMAGGPWPENPRECESPICRQWAEDLLP